MFGRLYVYWTCRYSFVLVLSMHIVWDFGNENVVILVRLSRLASQEVVKMITSCASSGNNFLKMTFSYQWWGIKFVGYNIRIYMYLVSVCFLTVVKLSSTYGVIIHLYCRYSTGDWYTLLFWSMCSNKPGLHLKQRAASALYKKLSDSGLYVL